MTPRQLADSNTGVAASTGQAAIPPPTHEGLASAAAADPEVSRTAPEGKEDLPAAAGAGPGQRLFDTQLHRSGLVNKKPVRVKREGKDIVCVLVDETIYAFHNRCPHTGYLMHEGRVRGCVVTCISHLAQFDLRDGHVVALPMEGRSIETGPLPVYRVVEQDGAIFVELPEE